MQSRAADFTRKLLLWGTLLVLTHFVVVIWHVELLIKVQPAFPGLAIVALILINLLPVAGLVAFAKGWPKLAGAMVVIPLGVALLVGGYTHFLSPGADNVLRMPPSELRLPFQVSAVLLVLLEVLGCWLGFRLCAFPNSSSRS